MAGKVKLGAPVPDAALQATGGRALRLAELRGKKLVLYFYPKDDTPGCTTEGQDFRDQYASFKRANAEVLGVSRDSLASHEKFKEKFRFPFDLVSDEDEHLCRLFGVIKEKNMYGKKVMGVERSTFILDENGVLQREFRGVKVPGHVDEILAEIENL